MKILLTYNKGFKWIKKDKVYFKGYLDHCNSDKIIDFLNTIDNFYEFKEYIKTLYGCFAIIINNTDRVFMAVDNARSIPLFYDVAHSIVSDNVQDMLSEYNDNKPEPDYELLIDYAYKRNCSPTETVFKDIRQLKAGECAQIDENKNVLIEKHYSHYGAHIDVKHDLSKDLFSAFTSMMKHLVDSLPERSQIVIPLSGGYDSRFLACLLKSYGFHDVICYTYGISEDYEVKNSRKVAEALGYKWYYVNYNRDKWKDFFSGRLDVLEYFTNCSNDCSLPHIQEFLALDELVQNKIIKKGDVIIPGFCGDVPAGSFTKNIDYDVYDAKQLISHIIKEHYINFPLNKYSYDVISKKLFSYLEENKFNVHDRDSFISAYEEWCICSRLSMWVVNSLRVYEHFELQWRIPMWDKDYLDYWYSVPNNMRENCLWYRQFIFTEFFSKFGVTMKKPTPSTLHTNKFMSSMAKVIKHILIYLSVKKGTDYYKRNNINDYNDAALIMIAQLKNKSMLTYNTLSVHLIEQIWWIQRRYENIDLKKILRGEL